MIRRYAAGFRIVRVRVDVEYPLDAVFMRLIAIAANNFDLVKNLVDMRRRMLDAVRTRVFDELCADSGESQVVECTKGGPVRLPPLLHKTDTNILTPLLDYANGDYKGSKVADALNAIVQSTQAVSDNVGNPEWASLVNAAKDTIAKSAELIKTNASSDVQVAVNAVYTYLGGEGSAKPLKIVSRPSYCINPAAVHYYSHYNNFFLPTSGVMVDGCLGKCDMLEAPLREARAIANNAGQIANLAALFPDEKDSKVVQTVVGQPTVAPMMVDLVNVTSGPSKAPVLDGDGKAIMVTTPPADGTTTTTVTSHVDVSDGADGVFKTKRGIPVASTLIDVHEEDETCDDKDTGCKCKDTLHIPGDIKLVSWSGPTGTVFTGP